jgi:hypothetical protein
MAYRIYHLVGSLLCIAAKCCKQKKQPIWLTSDMANLKMLANQISGIFDQQLFILCGDCNLLLDRYKELVDSLKISRCSSTEQGP